MLTPVVLACARASPICFLPAAACSCSCHQHVEQCQIDVSVRGVVGIHKHVSSCRLDTVLIPNTRCWCSQGCLSPRSTAYSPPTLCSFAPLHTPELCTACGTRVSLCARYGMECPWLHAGREAQYFRHCPRVCSAHGLVGPQLHGSVSPLQPLLARHRVFRELDDGHRSLRRLARLNLPCSVNTAHAP